MVVDGRLDKELDNIRTFFYISRSIDSATMSPIFIFTLKDNPFIGYEYQVKNWDIVAYDGIQSVPRSNTVSLMIIDMKVKIRELKLDDIGI